MSKQVKSTSNIVENNLNNLQVIPKEQALSYAIPLLSKFYAELNPNITTLNTSNVLYFNSSEDVEDNAYPAKLLDLYTNASATHSNLINLKRNMLIGDGLIPVDPNSQITIDFINKENSYGESLQNIWSKLCLDYAIFEAYGLELLYSADGLVSNVNHICPSLIRAVQHPNENIPFVDTWMLSYKWDRISNKNFRKYTVATSGLPIANFSKDTWAEDGARQLMYAKRYTAGNIPYAIPVYNSILPYVQLDNALSTYNLNSVTKGFTPQTIVSLVGSPSQEEKDVFVNKFKQRYSTQYGERILFIWSTNADDKPVILPFNENDNTPMLELLDKILTQKIASGHGANLELAGIQGTGGQSLQADANKIATSYNFYYATVIAPMQKTMVEYLNKIMRLNGLSDVTVVTPPLALETPVAQAAAVPQANNINQG